MHPKHERILFPPILAQRTAHPEPIPRHTRAVTSSHLNLIGPQKQSTPMRPLLNDPRTVPRKLEMRLGSPQNGSDIPECAELGQTGNRQSRLRADWPASSLYSVRPRTALGIGYALLKTLCHCQMEPSTFKGSLLLHILVGTARAEPSSQEAQKPTCNLTFQRTTFHRGGFHSPLMNSCEMNTFVNICSSMVSSAPGKRSWFCGPHI